MTRIEDLLHRRTDLSTFLVHLTRALPDGTTARENLLSIAANNRIEGRTPLGPAAHLETHLGPTATQKVVCFTEIPLEHTWMMLEDIEGRSICFQPYGLAITKTTARKSHINPIWYSDISTRGGRSWPMAAVNKLVNAARDRATTPTGELDSDLLQDEPIFALTPFFEQMGPMTNGGRKEFWWEREWRHIGDYGISFPRRIVAIFAPAEDHDTFRAELANANERWGRRPILDPRWGLERMVAALAGLDSDQIGPFPDAY